MKHLLMKLKKSTKSKAEKIQVNKLWIFNTWR
jgi:hypothetical protein